MVFTLIRAGSAGAPSVRVRRGLWHENKDVLFKANLVARFLNDKDVVEEIDLTFDSFAEGRPVARKTYTNIMGKIQSIVYADGQNLRVNGDGLLTIKVVNRGMPTLKDVKNAIKVAEKKIKSTSEKVALRWKLVPTEEGLQDKLTASSPLFFLVDKHPATEAYKSARAKAAANDVLLNALEDPQGVHDTALLDALGD